MIGLIRFGLLTIALAVGTVALGWWAVPVIAFVFGMTAPGWRRLGGAALLAGACAWALLLMIPALRDAPVRRFAGQLAQSMELPVVALFGATLVFPALLSWSAASLGARALRGKGTVRD